MLAGKYKIDTSNADIVLGYRADNSYFKLIDAFLEAKLTIDEVDRMFCRGQLGKQFFIKSPEAFKRINFIDSEKVKENDEYGTSDSIAIKDVSTFLNARKRAILIEGFDVKSQGYTVTDALNKYLEYKQGCYCADS